LFVYYRIHFNPHVLLWIEVKFSSSSTSICSDIYLSISKSAPSSPAYYFATCPWPLHRSLSGELAERALTPSPQSSLLHVLRHPSRTRPPWPLMRSSCRRHSPASAPGCPDQDQAQVHPVTDELARPRCATSGRSSIPEACRLPTQASNGLWSPPYCTRAG
jgi:hypothetical protein